MEYVGVRRPGARMAPMTTVPERLQPLLDPASPVQQVARRLVDAGYECFLVGGTVRDALLGRTRADGHEFDFATNARPDVVEELVSGWADHLWLQGQRFGTVGFLRDGVPMEITTYRAEVYRPESRKPDVVFADDIETDLSRRDFTVNAMALRLPEPELIDPYGGAVDLAARRLRTPLEPEVSFLDDPLRMLRAARFIADFDLVPEPALVQAVGELRPRLEIVSAERIRDELSKLLLVDDPSAGLWFLVETRPLRRVPPRARAPCASSRIRCTRTRTSSRTRSRSCATREPRAARAPRRAVPRRRASRRRGRSRPVR